jgi:hypothetical protein
MPSDNALEAFFEPRKRAKVAPRRSINVHIQEIFVQRAFSSLRHPQSHDADAVTERPRSRWYDLVEAPSVRYAAARLRRAFGKRGDRSNFEGDCSNFEGDRSNSRRDAE